jgi:hypothetical protein
LVINHHSSVVGNIRILATVIAVIGGFQPAYAEMLPFAASPTGEVGGLLAGEFERRTLDGDMIYVRRVCLRFGYTPSHALAFWGEGGIGSLQMFANSRQPQGSFGPAFGIGWTLKLFSGDLQNWTPFINGRVTSFMSKLSDDYAQGTSARSRRSRFTWTEGSGLIGFTKSIRKTTWYGGVALRDLMQDEKRSFRSGATVQKSQFSYDSGLKPGAALGASFELESHALVWVGLEGYTDGVRVSVAAGQWGLP